MVVGAGQMGAGIAQIVAQAGILVVLHDKSQQLLDQGMATIERTISCEQRSGRRTPTDKAAVLRRISLTLGFEEASDCDIVIEASAAKTATKQAIFKALDRTAPPRAIFASAASSATIAAVADATGRPEQVVGLLFAYPVPTSDMVGIVRGFHTSDEVFQAIRDFIAFLGKKPVESKAVP